MTRDETHLAIADTVRLLVLLEAALGAKVIMAGGAVRDLIHGVYPKDLDFCVLADATCDSYDDLLTTAEGALSLLDNVKVLSSSSAYREGSDLRLAYVIKFEYMGMQCDLIQYVEEDATCNPRGQVSHFDANINMVWMDSTGNIVLEPEALEVVTRRTAITKLARAFMGDGDRARLDYLHQKYPQYAVDHVTVITPEVV